MNEIIDNPVTDIVDTLEASASLGVEEVGQLLSSSGRDAFAPTLLIPSLMLVSPLSGIPLFSTCCGIVIAIIAIQAALSRRGVWLPSQIFERRLKWEHVKRVTTSVRKPVRFIERLIKPRWQALVTPPASRAIYAFITLIALCIPVMELVPFSSTLIGVGFSSFAIAIIARDGVWLIPGFGFIIAALIIPITMVVAVAEHV